METPPLKRRKKFVSVLPLSVAAHRQLLRKILPPVSPLLNTWSTSMVPTVVLVKNEYCEPRLEINENEQCIVVSRFFYAAPLRRQQLTHSLYF